MSDENNADPIGEPQPVEAPKGRAILKKFAAVVVVSVGGVLVFAPLLAPTNVRGATRSGRLKWQQRQNEIQEAIAPVSPVETGVLATDSQDQPPQRDSK